MEDKVIFDTNIEDAPKIEVPKTQKKATKQTKVRMENNEDIEVGSVSYVIHYFKYMLNMNFDNSLSISESFRKYFEQEDKINDNRETVE